MAYTSEIEKLERRSAENPQGRLFAPLADAYRKQGELERAMTLLREGLERHPDYIGAQIVLGRCHLDLGSDDEAAAAFARVLDLDGENVIALKALAEIDERGGRAGEAIARLGRLLEIDRGNEEAAAHLGRLRSAGPLPAAAEPSVDADAPPPPPAGIQLASGFGPGAMAEEPTPPPAPLPGLLAGAAEPPAEHSQRLEGLETAPTPEWERSPEGEGDDFVLERESDILLEGSAENEFQSRSDAEKLAARDPDGGGRHPWQDVASETPAAPAPFVPWEAAAAPAPAPAPEPEPAEAVEPVDIAEEVAEVELVEMEVVEAGDPGTGVEVIDVMEVVDVVEVVDTVEDLPFIEPPSRRAAEPPEPPELADAGEPDEPDLVVTETMAAVYERQGLSQDALRVYRELAARRPEDGRLAAKVAELEAAAA
ncbi:MAG TPA: tetratricopeptide repeat protein, partial [Gemmatimonadales bacterium]|nr:tetratricopeptide repeat protein [Gemmatimonadales bacterium]